MITWRSLAAVLYSLQSYLVFPDVRLCYGTFKLVLHSPVHSARCCTDPAHDITPLRYQHTFYLDG